MIENLSSDPMAILSQVLEEMKQEKGAAFVLRDVNLSELERRTGCEHYSWRGGAQLMSKRTDPGEAEYNDFDYDNVDPETLKKWEEEFRREKLRDMRSYLKRFPDATPEEKKALRSWVRKGRSPYENGWYIANESGGPMDFINALRFLEDEYQEFLKDPEGYRGCPDEQPEIWNSPSGSSADDLPF